ncbi:MAG: MFS transporter [Rhodospirillales bacterium]|nr:MFS transporter [Rhodospirillales bacterium]
MGGQGEDSKAGTEPRSAGRLALAAWCSFDWANSAYPTVIATFIFGAYFTKAVAVDTVTGTAQWGYAMSLSALAVAILSPVMGAIADRTGRRKPWLFVFTVICITGTALLWFTEPDPAWVLWALVLVALSNAAFEMGMVFYNAMLPALAPKEMIGRLSGWGWGFGYFGGLICLAVALVGLVQTDTPWFGISKDNGENIRATALLVALWFAVFAAPLFVFTPDAPAGKIGLGRALVEGMGQLWDTLRSIRQYADIFRFLIARMIFIDGLGTIFAFGGIYAAGTFGMSFTELIMFGIGINVTAGLGAAAFAWIDDWIGPKKTILISLGALVVLCTALVIVEGKTLFWVFGLPLGIFVGPVQSASRSYMARLAPPDMRNQMFGLFAFSGKVTAFLGPALLAVVTDAFQSQRLGMATIIVFLVVGGLLLLKVPSVGGKTQASDG